MPGATIRRTHGICDFCLDVLCYSNKTWGEHHSSLAGINKSVDEGCTFCLSSLHDLKECYSDLNSLTWPLYRWNLRRPARTRESNEILAVTFRPLAEVAFVQSDGQVKKLPERTFQFHRSSDLGSIPDEEELGESTDSAQSWTQIARWIKDCTENHPHCKPRTGNQAPVPTRLLDISAIDLDSGTYGNIIVVKTGPLNITEPYVTLSHCWGCGPSFKELRGDNIDILTSEGVSWTDPDLPKNFKDAIIVARHLGRRYIWIDSLCIIQKDEADFDHEAPLMHQYYRYSYCNIAAAASSDSRGGLFRKRLLSTASKHSGIAPSKLLLDPSSRVFGKHEWRIIPQDIWDSQLLENPLYTRGWVFQERMLSPRLLHFSHRQIFYDCATLSASESLPQGLPRSLDVTASTDRHWRERLQQAGSSLKHRPLAGTADASVEDFWRTAVKNYTSCNLTKGKDKLMAIWGVAKLVTDALGEQYGDGLWSHRLEEQLAWRVLDADGKQQENGLSVTRRPRPPRAPTWSWASIDGVIDVQDRAPPDERQYKVLNHNGESIRFQLHGSSNRSSKTTPKVQSPQEEFESWEVGVEKLKEQRKLSSRTSSQSSIAHALSRTISTENQILDEAIPPKLDSWAIEIQGHVRQGQIVKSTRTERLTLHATGTTFETSVSDAAIMEIFLDDLPGQGTINCEFMVLAYSKVTVDRQFQFPAFGSPSLVQQEPQEMHTVHEDNENGYDSDDYNSDVNENGDVSQDQSELQIKPDDGQVTTSGQYEVSNQQPKNRQQQQSSWISDVSNPGPATFYGLGLLLKDIGAHQFKRIGSFRFRDYDAPALSTLTRVHGHSQQDRDFFVEEGRGRKMWLV